MTEEFENLLGELKKLPRGTEHAPEYLRHIMRLFVADFESSMSKRLDIKFWKCLKKLIDEMGVASGNDRLVENNTHNLAVGFLTDLSLLCHLHYELDCSKLPAYLTFGGVASMRIRKGVEFRKNSKVFQAYLMLRMGDLMRYKNSIKTTREYYELSSKINPADGAVWNQLGVAAALSAQNLEAVYFYTRALHATMEFSTASSSLTAIFKKFANRDPTKPMPTNDLFLACLSKIHFLMEIENSEEMLKIVGKSVGESKEMIVALMSVYHHLEGGTELEDRSIDYIHDIWSHAHRRILEILRENLGNPDEKFQEDLILLEFLKSFGNSESSENLEFLQDFLKKNSQIFVKDSNGFGYFECLHNLKFPLKFGDLVKNEKLESSVENQDLETTFEDEENEEKMENKVKEPKKEYQNESESDEEILQRGKRRGRAKPLDSVDTDEEDF